MQGAKTKIPTLDQRSLRRDSKREICRERDKAGMRLRKPRVARRDRETLALLPAG